MFIITAAFRTSTRDITRIDVDSPHTVQPRLVYHLETQVVKRPAMQSGFLRPSSRDPVANACQIFQGIPASSALSLNHDALADTVIGIVSETLFFACQLTHQAFSGLGSFLLQFAAQMAMPVAHLINVATTVLFPITIHRDIHNTPVDAKKRIDFNWRWLVNFARRQQKELAVVEIQIGFAFLVCQQLALSLAALIRHFDPPANDPDRDCFSPLSIRQNAVVVGDRPVGFEGSLRLFVPLVTVRHLAQASHGYLSRQVELLAKCCVQGPVQFELIKHLVFPGVITNYVASGIGTLKNVDKRIFLFGCWEYLDLGRQFHTPQFTIKFNQLKRASAFLRWINPRVSCAFL